MILVAVHQDLLKGLNPLSEFPADIVREALAIQYFNYQRTREAARVRWEAACAVLGSGQPYTNAVENFNNARSTYLDLVNYHVTSVPTEASRMAENARLIKAYQEAFGTIND